jgi:hypothetical protein
LSIKIDLPNPIARILFEIEQQEADDILLLFDLDLRNDPGEEDPAQMDGGEQYEERIKRKQDGDQNIKDLAGRGERVKGAYDDAA